MKKNKKAQIAGQIFIYIMTVVVIGIIVLIGYWSIQKIVPKTCQVENINFKTNIESLIEKYNTYGSVNKEYMTSPCDFEQICFVDTRVIKDLDPLIREGFKCSNQIITSSVKDGSKDNIFMVSSKKTVPVAYSELVQVEDSNINNCTCITQKNKNFYITFKGLGYGTIIS